MVERGVDKDFVRKIKNWMLFYYKIMCQKVLKSVWI